TSGMRLKPRVRLGAIVALAIAAGFVVWLIVRGNDNSPTSTATTVSTSSGTTGAEGTHLGPVAVTEAGLSSAARSLKTTIYWAGPKPGFTYALTRTNSGRVYVRYLPSGIRVGDPRASYLIIATYPFPNALKAL